MCRNLEFLKLLISSQKKEGLNKKKNTKVRNNCLITSGVIT